MKAPIVEEVRRIREAHAARFGYDLDAIFRDIEEQEKKSGCKFVSIEESARHVGPRFQEDEPRNFSLG